MFFEHGGVDDKSPNNLNHRLPHPEEMDHPVPFGIEALG